MNFFAVLAQIIANFDIWSTGEINAPELYPGSHHNHKRFENYQIDAPSADFGPPCHEALLMEHEFGASWGQPYTVPYTPFSSANDGPDSSIDFSYVKLTMEVNSFGIQYDRLAHVFINGVELWRPSTSEPRGKASHSSFTKDVSAFKSLLAEPGVLSVELDNLVTARLNGTFSVKLWASYFCPPERISSNTWYEHESLSADKIQPVVQCLVTSESVNTKLPAVSRNTTRAVLQVFASGNGNDEFWYAESSNSEEDDRLGPIRHLKVQINGELAGVISPFYQVYTGGFQPALWSPFVAPNAYDVPSYHIDITTYLPLIWGSSNQDLSIIVTNGQDREVKHEWILSAALFTWESNEWRGEGGDRQPSSQHNSSSRIVLPSIEIFSFKQNLITAADLRFRNIRTGAVSLIPVNFSQEHKIDATLVGETVISHDSRGISTTAYDSRNYSLSYHYDIALVLNETSISTALGYDLHEHAYSSTEDLLSRSHSVHYNGSWHLEPFNQATEKQQSLERRPSEKNKLYHFLPRDSDKCIRARIDDENHSSCDHKVNGSDVFVKFRDPHRIGKLTYHQHAVSRNGSIISFDDPPDNNSHANYKSKVIEDSLPEMAGFPFVTLSDQELRQRRAIRKKWLHHSL